MRFDRDIRGQKFVKLLKNWLKFFPAYFFVDKKLNYLNSGSVYY